MFCEVLTSKRLTSFVGNLVIEKHAASSVKKTPHHAFSGLLPDFNTMAQATAGLNSLGSSFTDPSSMYLAEQLIMNKFKGLAGSVENRLSQNSPDLTNYGIVLQTEPKMRTAHVKWIQVKTAKPSHSKHKEKGNVSTCACSSAFLVS